MINLSKKIVFGLCLASLTACSGGGDWPNLSDRLPDPAERVRVREEATPARPQFDTESAPTTEAEAIKITTDVKAVLVSEKQAYEAAKAKLASALTDDDKKDFWLEAQLTLTRLSRSLSRLDPILEGESSETPSSTAASSLKDAYEPYIVSERQFLMQHEPT